MSDSGVGTITYDRPIGLPGVDIMRAEQDSQYWRVFHEDYVLCSCRAAAAQWRYRHRDYRLQDLRQMLLEPGEMHVNTRVLKPADFVVVSIPPNVMADAARELGRPDTPHFREGQVSDHVLHAALFALCACDADNVLEQQSRFAHLQHLVLERHMERGVGVIPVRRDRHAIERARCYIKENVSEVITLTQLSRVAGLSRFHLVRSFTRHVGVAPHRYQICVRVARARRLLKKGASIAEAALSTGFADQSHLTRHFRQTFGITPGRFIAL